MRVAIITMLEENYNYGAVLQAYALVNFVKSLGYTCEVVRLTHYVDVISNKKPDIEKTRMSIVARIKRKIDNPNELMDRVYNKIGKALGIYSVSGIKKSEIMDIKMFDKFISDYIPRTKLYNRNNIHELNNEFDVFICGSDQIWKPECTNGTYFLDFCDKNKLRIAYAPSISMYRVDDEVMKYYQEKLCGFDSSYISVRESAGAEILKHVIKKELPVVVDPTLLLLRDEWVKIAKSIDRIIKEPYCFSYLLTPNYSATRKIRKSSNKRKQKMVNISYGIEKSYYQHRVSDYPLEGIGPIEFLNLIFHADYIYTDSYHGLIFSIIFKKAFSVIERNVEGEKKQMISRFETIFDIAKCKDRSISVDGIGTEEITENDYYANLRQNISQSSEFLKNTLTKDKIAWD